MSATAPTPVLRCTQCGGELHPDQGQIFLTCPFCSSTIYLDKTQVVFHWYLAPTLDQPKAQGALARWMAGNQTVKDLDKKARLSGATFEYFPLWYFKLRSANGREHIRLEPAAALSVSELKNLSIPAGDLRKYDPDLDSQSQPPSVPLSAAQKWLHVEQGQNAPQVLESALVHLPVFTFKYTFQGQTYTALVEAATGRVLANIYPAKAETPYLLIGGVTALVYLGLALLPVLGALTAGGEGFTIGLAACSALGALAAPVLIAIAVWVAARV